MEKILYFIAFILAIIFSIICIIFMVKPSKKSKIRYEEIAIGVAVIGIISSIGGFITAGFGKTYEGFIGVSVVCILFEIAALVNKYRGW